MFLLPLLFIGLSAGATYFATASVALTIATVALGLGQILLSELFAPKFVPDTSNLKFNNASVGFPIPIVFGIAKVNPNFIHHNPSNFYQKPVVQKTKGLFGSKKQTIGWDYYHKFALGICIGPIDRILEIRTSGSDNGIKSGPIVFTSNYADFNFSPSSGDTEKDSGPIRVYRGTNTQTRISSQDPYFSIPTPIEGLGTQNLTLNYRNVCWALYKNHFLGRNNPNVPSHTYIIQRLPTEVPAGMKTRGSDDSENHNYNLANPAAAIYELCFSSLYGAGLPKDSCDEASFIEAADFYAANNMGLGFAITEHSTLKGVLDGLKNHLKFTLLRGDNGKLRFINLLDNTQNTVKVIYNDDIIEKSLKIGVSTIHDTYNHLQATFTDPNTQSRGSYDYMEQFNINAVGFLKTQTLNLEAFQDLGLVRRTLARQMREIAYPLKTFDFDTNLFLSDVEQGDFLRIAFRDVNSLEPTYNNNVIAFMTRVVEVSEPATNEGVMRIKCVEDPNFEILEIDESEILNLRNAANIYGDVVAEDDIYQPIDVNLAAPADVLIVELDFVPDAYRYDATAQKHITNGLSVCIMPNYAVGTSSDFTVGRIIGGDSELYPADPRLTERSLGKAYVGTFNGTLTGENSWFVDYSNTGILVDVAGNPPELTANNFTGTNNDLEQILEWDSGVGGWLWIKGEFIKWGAAELVSGTTYRFTKLARNCVENRWATHTPGTPTEVRVLVGALTDFIVDIAQNWENTIISKIQDVGLGLPVDFDAKGTKTYDFTFAAYGITSARSDEVDEDPGFFDNYGDHPTGITTTNPFYTTLTGKFIGKCARVPAPGVRYDGGGLYITPYHAAYVKPLNEAYAASADVVGSQYPSFAFRFEYYDAGGAYLGVGAGSSTNQWQWSQGSSDDPVLPENFNPPLTAAKIRVYPYVTFGSSYPPVKGLEYTEAAIV